MKNSSAYHRLTKRFERHATINECASVLGWDAAAMMPPGGAAARGDQLAVLAGLAHAQMIAKDVADDLAEAEAMPVSPDPWAAANLRLMRHAHTRATAVPADLVEAQARANSNCEKVWREAKRTSDFNLVRPHLTEVVNLVRRQASALGPALGLSHYDALMDGYQRGIGTADVAAIFGAYEEFLAEALPAAEERQARTPAPVKPSGPFPISAQEAVCRLVSERMGLDFDHARLDRSAHPFSGGTQTDVRITTRYDTADFTQAVMAVIHETGHALYERGLPAGHARQPVGEAAGMAIHESQSLIVEMLACRDDEYLAWLGRVLHAGFGGEQRQYQVENLSRVWRRVERGFIRVEADEMTYPAHVIMRFRLERALVSGNLSISDLPGAWNDSLRDLLGIVPPDDAHGCLQDIHWYDGAFGYFPSYTLGAMAAAQFMATARQHGPGLKTAMGLGDLSPLMNWLRVNVHMHGSVMGFNDLLETATGQPLDPGFFLTHLRTRYLS
ncbi:MAG: carboxypeptidase M32 [Acetobacteraceae bacterium]|nr:carboxypeptidase M32 [Acetobacteraceae bacterium]